MYFLSFLLVFSLEIILISVLGLVILVLQFKLILFQLVAKATFFCLFFMFFIISSFYNTLINKTKL